MFLQKKYKNISQLGKGAYGVVNQALGPDNRVVAIKKYSHLTGKSIPYLVLREINTMKMLNHPNIIHAYDVFMNASDMYVIMEYGGENLRHYMLSLTFEQRIEQLQHVSYQLLAGCSYMHKLDIIHRDLKPDNILVLWNDEKQRPIVKICDFGLAKKLLPFKRDNNSYQIGTLSYRPPELFTKIETYTESVDVWSMGCVLYEFITDRMIFPGKADMEVLMKILQQVPTTAQDLQILQLDMINLEKCNEDNYYKLPALYDLSIRCKKTKQILEQFRSLVERMLILDPHKRITLEEAAAHSFFDDVRHCYIDTKSSLQNYRITCSQNFRIREPIKLPIQLRAVCVEHVISMKHVYAVSDQAIFVAINIFDKFLSLQSKSEIEKIRHTLLTISNCCVALASRYVDVKHIALKTFVTKEFSLKKLIVIERNILEQIDFDFNQPTLINFYKELMNDKLVEEKDDIPENVLSVARNMILNYEQLIGKGIPELKEIFLDKIKKA
jgi:serine/threonine protein kinase